MKATPSRRIKQRCLMPIGCNSGRVSASGEGQWPLAAAIDEGVPAPVFSSAFSGRLASRADADYADRLLSAVRTQCGGRDEKSTAGG